MHFAAPRAVLGSQNRLPSAVDADVTWNSCWQFEKTYASFTGIVFTLCLAVTAGRHCSTHAVDMNCAPTRFHADLWQWLFCVLIVLQKPSMLRVSQRSAMDQPMVVIDMLQAGENRRPTDYCGKSRYLHALRTSSRLTCFAITATQSPCCVRHGARIVTR